MPDLDSLFPGLPVAAGLAGLAIALLTYAAIIALMPGSGGRQAPEGHRRRPRDGGGPGP